MIKMPNITVSGCVVVSFFVMATIGFFIPQELYGTVDVDNRLRGVSFSHVLGTDMFGRDVFIRIVRGATTVAIVAIPSVAMGVLFGGFFAIISAYKKSNIRYIIGGFMDMIFAFPTILIALVLSQKIGASPWVATVSLGILFIPIFYRVLYLQSRILWQKEYVVSARLSKVSECGIAWRHIIPNLMPLVVTQSAIQFALAILAEAGLGYLGVSVRSPEPTWGSLLLDAQAVVFLNPLYILPIGVCICITVWGFISYGDTRDTVTWK